MNFDLSEKQLYWRDRVRAFIQTEIRPNQGAYHHQLDTHGDWTRWTIPPIVEQLKAKAKAAGLWNLFMPPSGDHAHVDESFAFDGPGLSNLEYALCAEEMGRIHWASEIFNCSPPDTGNMEVLHRYATREQKDAWLAPLMKGTMRSVFLMTEPAVASSDATNIQCSILRDGDEYVINGRKWWSTGAGDPRCKIGILMGKSDPSAPRHSQQSMILIPMDTPGVAVERTLSVFGYDHAPQGHMQVAFHNARVPAQNILLGEGRGFEIAQGRLGPGRIHHCMRIIGAAEEALEALCQRALTRVPFGKTVAEQSVWEQRIGEARTNIEMTRLLCLKAADMMDKIGNKGAQGEIAMIKVAAPNMALKIIDDAIQAHGGGGVCQDFGLAFSYADVRTLRIADGPDEVHNRAIARIELGKYGGREAMANARKTNGV